MASNTDTERRRRMVQMVELLALLLMGGCEQPPSTVDVVDGGVAVYEAGTFRVVNVDGVRCVTWQLGYAGGLSCDFSEARP